VQLSDYDSRWIRRIMARTLPIASGCLLWQGTKAINGYGQAGYRGKNAIVHRRLYQIIHGVTLSKDHDVCHSCDVRLCVNPAHLWLGSRSDNMHDSVKKGRHYKATRTECPRGHPYDEQNTYLDTRGKRQCRACQRRRLRLQAGWPPALAETAPKGYRFNEATLTAST
jgi:hypothetical protein